MKIFVLKYFANRQLMGNDFVHTDPVVFAKTAEKCVSAFGAYQVDVWENGEKISSYAPEDFVSKVLNFL